MADSGRMRKRQIENESARAVGVDGGKRGRRTKGGGPSFADVVEDEASASVRGMSRESAT